MSGDLISREALMQFPIRLNHFDEVNGDVKYVFGVEDVLEYAQNLPAVDAVPVVHGRWIDMREAYNDVPHCKCSLCGRMIYGLEVEYPYCPDCGALMRGDSDATE